MKSENIFKWMTLLIFLALLTPWLGMKGMFLDGTTYVAIARNMAVGIGDFWAPHYTKNLYPYFVEHPPLGLIVQSFFFKCLGDHFYTERIFSFSMTVLTAMGIVLCWRALTDRRDVKNRYWLPVLLWLLVPIVSWSYNNNMLENILTVCTTFSVFLIIKSIKEGHTLLIPVSALLIIFAFLCKGFVGLFPIITPLIYGLCFNSLRESTRYFLWLAISLALLSMAIWLGLPELKTHLISYFHQQVFPSILGNREITSHWRFGILIDLLLDISLVLGLCSILIFWKKKSGSQKNPILNRKFYFSLMVALCASVPLIISLKQRKFYLIPSIPFYALGFAFLVHDTLPFLTEKISVNLQKWLRVALPLGCAMVLLIAVFNFGSYARDKNKIEDVLLFSKSLEPGSMVACRQEMMSEWGLIAYLTRIGYISLDSGNEHAYFLIKNGTPPPENYTQIAIEGKMYSLLSVNQN